MKLDALKEILYHLVGVLYDVHKELGPGLNEYVYQEGLEFELKNQSIPFEREKEFHPMYRGVELSATYRMDFVFMDNVIIECKAVSKINSEHRAQLFNYMRLTKLRAGILVNFAPRFMEIERYFYDADSNEILTFDGKTFTNLNQE